MFKGFKQKDYHHPPKIHTHKLQWGLDRLQARISIQLNTVFTQTWQRSSAWHSSNKTSV